MKDSFEISLELDNLQLDFEQTMKRANESLSVLSFERGRLQQRFLEYVSEAEKMEAEWRRPLQINEPVEMPSSPGIKTKLPDWKGQDFEKLFLEQRQKLRAIDRIVSTLMDIADEAGLSEIAKSLLNKVQKLSNDVELK